ncbi:MAG: DUF799 family lipoprotein [Nitrospirae bacterium]|nr:DUF799 family lipoprotein [Nitrospirota bacterium]
MKFQRQRAFRVLLLLSFASSALFFTSGCITTPPPNPNNPLANTAVLPMVNNTNDLDGPMFVRTAFNQIVLKRHYETMPLAQIDGILKDKMGITLGGQLDFTNPGAGAPLPQEIGKLLGVDYLFYGTLIEFKQIIIGVYNKTQVKVKFKLINARTGEVMWEQEAEEGRSEINTSVSDATESAIKKFTGTALTKAFKANPLKPETNAVVLKLMKTLPSGYVIK